MHACSGSSLLLVTLGSGIMAPASVSSRSSFTVTDCVATSFGTSKVSLSEDLSFTCRGTEEDIALAKSAACLEQKDLHGNDGG